ncbi:hypothetical protein PsAD5_05063 [Pseudovibrio sp. Ad5]|nr:hypothetical protein PsAD5_05063 [Pseudovibrio sp. Ad5]
MNRTSKSKVWSKAKKIKGKNPSKYRQDPYGKTIHYNSHGKASPMGWDVDHIKPKSRGSNDNIRNLQALSSGINRSKGNSLVKKSRHSKCNK